MVIKDGAKMLEKKTTLFRGGVIVSLKDCLEKSLNVVMEMFDESRYFNIR